MITENNEKYEFKDLLDIMKKLRSLDGCPWDRKQTHKSLRQYLIEETYELIEVINLGDMEKVCDELGDVLLQVVFHAQIAEENGGFNIDDVTDAICRKMISRHTHVFGDNICTTPEEVLSSWDKIKKVEKGQRLHADSLRDIPKELPGLTKANKVQQKASKIGFDWEDINDVYKKIEEETEEVKAAVETGDQDKIEDEIGDLLFSCVNLSRFIDVHPEIALNKATAKFVIRFARMEQKALENKRKLEDMDLNDMDELWNEIKGDEAYAD